MNERTIIALCGPSQRTKTDALDVVLRNLEADHGGRATAVDATRQNSPLVFETTHTRVGIIRAGNDPRKPNGQELEHLISSRCRLILCPVSNGPAAEEELALLAVSKRYQLVYWTPIRVEPSPLSLSYDDVGGLSKGWMMERNGEALSSLVQRLISK